MDRKYLSGITALVISLALLIITVFGPWFHQDLYGEGYDGKIDCKLYELKVTASTIWGERTEKFSYSDRAVREDMPNTVTVFYVTLILAIISICLLALFLISLTKQKRQKRAKICTAAIILAILIPIFFMIALPIADKMDSEAEEEEFLEESGFLLWGWSRVDYGELGVVKVFSNAG